MRELVLVSVILLTLDHVYLSNFGAKPFLNMVEKFKMKKLFLNYLQP